MFGRVLQLPELRIDLVMPAVRHAFVHVLLLFHPASHFARLLAEPKLGESRVAQITKTVTLVAEERATGVDLAVAGDLRDERQTEAAAVGARAIVAEGVPADDA